jgi:DNA-binding transcriptional ArsR family regulator
MARESGDVDSLQAVAEPRRRAILRLVWNQELSAGAIAARFDVSFPAISQHLGVLKEVGAVTMRREGRSRFYRADKEALDALRPVLERMWSTQLDRLAELAEQEEASS